MNRVYEVTYNDSRMPTLSNYYDYDPNSTVDPDNKIANRGKLTEVKTASAANDTDTSWDDSIPETHLNYDFDQIGRTVMSSQTVGSYVYAFEYSYNLGGQMTQEAMDNGQWTMDNA